MVAWNSIVILKNVYINVSSTIHKLEYFCFSFEDHALTINIEYLYKKKYN